MTRAELTIANKLGLHARAAAKLTQVATGFQSEVWLTRNGRRVNAKSIMGVMMLAAGKGASVTVEAIPLPARMIHGTPAHRHESTSKRTAAKVSVSDFFATPGSSR